MTAQTAHNSGLYLALRELTAAYRTDTCAKGEDGAPVAPPRELVAPYFERARAAAQQLAGARKTLVLNTLTAVEESARQMEGQRGWALRTPFAAIRHQLGHILYSL